MEITIIHAQGVMTDCSLSALNSTIRRILVQERVGNVVVRVIWDEEEPNAQRIVEEELQQEYVAKRVDTKSPSPSGYFNVSKMESNPFLLPSNAAKGANPVYLLQYCQREPEFRFLESRHTDEFHLEGDLVELEAGKFEVVDISFLDKVSGMRAYRMWLAPAL